MNSENSEDAQNILISALKTILKYELEKGSITTNEFANNLYRTNQEALGLIYTLKSMNMIEFLGGKTDHIILTEGAKKNLRIVLTGGVFDILHIGHIKTLKEAKKLGDFLVVVVASDSVVKKNKGEKHPINNQDKRVELLKQIKLIDYVNKGIEGGDDSSEEFYNVINQIKPNSIILGYDQKHKEKEMLEKLEEMGLNDIEIVRLKIEIPDEKSSLKLNFLKK